MDEKMFKKMWDMGMIPHDTTVEHKAVIVPKLEGRIVSGFPAGKNFSSFIYKSNFNYNHLRQDDLVSLVLHDCIVMGYDFEEKLLVLKLETKNPDMAIINNSYDYDVK